MFSTNLQYVKLQNFLSVKLKHNGPSDDIKTSKCFSYNFSQYSIEELIWTLHIFVCVLLKMLVEI